MPRISEFHGIVVYMYYDDHEPPHFHAYYGQHEAVIEIVEGTIARGYLPPHVARVVRRWLREYREEIEENWLLARDHQRLAPIPPVE